MSEVLLITGNAGQGKTTIAANIATTLARFGNPTILVNADKLTPKLHYHFGIQIPNGRLYSHASGLQMRFKSTEPEQIAYTEHTTIVDVPTYSHRYYQSGHPTVIVTKPDFPSVLETLKLIKSIQNVKGVIINEAENDGYELSAGNIHHFLQKPVLGVIPRETSMREALKKGQPVTELHPDKQTTTVMKKIAANLINQQYHTSR